MDIEKQIELLNQSLSAMQSFGVNNAMPKKDELVNMLLSLHKEVIFEREMESRGRKRGVVKDSTLR